MPYQSGNLWLYKIANQCCDSKNERTGQEGTGKRVSKKGMHSKWKNGNSLVYCKMTRYKVCGKCSERAVRIGGETYRTNEEKHQKFTIGTYCMKCHTLELDPKVPIKDIVMTEALQIHA